MKKRGRKSGSSSFIQVSLSDLNNALKPGAKVIIWNRYASMLGLEGKPVEAKYDVLMASVGSGTTEFELEDFENAKFTNDSSKNTEPLISQDKNTEDLVQKPQVSFEIF
jgi:hypothetical protein